MHSLRTMSVVAKQQKAVQDQLYEYQVRQAGFAVFDTVTTGIHQRLRIFRTHHQKCVARRRNALGYELKQENQRTEWLKRKYIDSASVRQQQQTMPARLDCPRGFEVADPSEQKEGSPEQGSSKPSKHCSKKAIDSSSPCSRISNVNNNGRIVDTSVIIKREPEPEEPPSPPRVSLDTAHLSKNENHSQGLELKRRLSQTVKNDNAKWSGAEDTRDELRLTAYDVIAGVINTHPIQPLEQDADNAHADASSASLPSSGVKGRSTTTVQTSHSVVPVVSTSTTITTAKKKDQHSLVKDLDEFSKVMDQVTQEQKAKERRVSMGELEASPPSVGPRLHGPPLYQGMSHPNENDYRQKYIQLQVAPPNPSQVDPVYQPKNAAKPRLVLPGLSDPPVSNGSHLPVTPTTPLEHFSTFHSPHLPLATNCSPVLPSPQGCPPPPPYSSTASDVCYPYDAVYQSAGSSIAEQWLPLQPHTQQALQHSATQENVRVSSCVVALAGQKRSGCELNSLPPTKLAYPPPPLSAPLHRYPDHPLYSPYPGSSSTFPH